MNEETRRIRLISSLALVLGGLVSFMGILRHVVEGSEASSTIYLLHFAGLFFISSHFYVKKTGETKVVSFLMILVGLIVTTIRSLSTGGLSGTPIAWFIGVPSFAAFVQGHKWVLPWSLASAMGASLSLLYPEWVTGVHSPLVNYIVLALLIFTISIMMWIFDRQRIKNEETIREQSLKIIQSEKLISLGTLAGGMAHEINNPLAIIKGYSDILKKKMMNMGDDQLMINTIGRTCDMIDENVKRISSITKHLLAFTQIGDRTQFENVVFVDLIEEVIRSSRGHLVEETKIDLVDSS